MSRNPSRPGKRPASSRRQDPSSSPRSGSGSGDAPFGQGEGGQPWFDLDPADTDPARIKRERDKARQLRKTAWWQDKIRRGVCEYCEKRVPPELLTLDHRVPLARGGRSAPGNVVAACKDCNRSKGLMTPVDALFEQLDRENKESAGEAGREGEAGEGDGSADE